MSQVLTIARASDQPPLTGQDMTQLAQASVDSMRYAFNNDTLIYHAPNGVRLVLQLDRGELFTQLDPNEDTARTYNALQALARALNARLLYEGADDITEYPSVPEQDGSAGSQSSGQASKKAAWFATAIVAAVALITIPIVLFLFLIRLPKLVWHFFKLWRGMK